MKKERVTVVLFGGTGDLTKRKLVPAFAEMIHDSLLSKNSTIIGVSRKNWSEEDYKKFLMAGGKDKRERSYIKSLDIKHITGDFTKECGVTGLKEIMSKCEKGYSCNRIYYLATSFKFFSRIVGELKRYGLHKGSNGYTRVVFEKPFGNDLKSSKKLDKEIHKAFKEEDVFRIDHYLAKETVQNLNLLKFTNPVLYGTFGNRGVKSVEVIVDERLGVGNRINYYNEAGALKDMIQNHLLQVLSLVLMERPKSLSPKHIHDKKVEVLKSLRVLSSGRHLLGQYKNYLEEARDEGIKGNGVDTFARIVLNSKMRRWKGVELILRTGKKLESKYGQVKITYNLAGEKFIKGVKGVEDNMLIVDIYPKQDMTLFMNSRKPKCEREVRGVKFGFYQDLEFGPNTSDEYATLLEEVILGNKTLFTRDDEVKESWKIVDKIEKMKSKIKFVRYKNNTDPEDVK